MQKYIDEKGRYCSSFFCFVTFHAGTGGIHKFIGFLIMLVFKVAFQISCWQWMLETA